MNNLFDEFSKSLAETVPRRESLRRLGAVFAGAVLSALGLRTAWAGRRDPCKAFCKCGTTKQQSQCLATCQACNGNTGRISGSCGKYVCCSTAACGGVCSDLSHDPNCGSCGNNCHALGKTCCGICRRRHKDQPVGPRRFPPPAGSAPHRRRRPRAGAATRGAAPTQPVIWRIHRKDGP